MVHCVSRCLLVTLVAGWFQLFLCGSVRAQPARPEGATLLFANGGR